MLVVSGPEQPEEHGQADRPAAQTRQRHDEHDDDPAVAPPRPASRPLGLRAVVQVVRAPYPAAGAPEQRVVDGKPDRRASPDEHRDQEVQQHKPDPVGIPAPPREEVVRAAVMSLAGQPGALQHPRHRAVADPADEPDHERAERLKRRLRKARRQQGQQPGKRSGNLTHGGDPPVQGPRPASSAPRGPMGLTPTGFGVAANPPLPCSGRQTVAARATRAGRHNRALKPRKPRNSS